MNNYNSEKCVENMNVELIVTNIGLRFIWINVMVAMNKLRQLSHG